MVGRDLKAQCNRVHFVKDGFILSEIQLLVEAFSKAELLFYSIDFAIL